MLNVQTFDQKYSDTAEALNWSLEAFQQKWDLINDDFSKYVERVTGYKWFYDTYECLLSLYHLGVSNWGDSNVVIRGWWENPYQSRRITAHELILSHYFHICKKHYQDQGITDGQVWALAEIAAFAVCSLTEDVKKWWPWYCTYFTDHNYPHIVDMQNELKKHFLEMKSFDEYMKKGFELVKKYPNMGPFV